MPFRVLHPPPGLIQNNEVEKVCNSMNSMTLTAFHFHERLQAAKRDPLDISTPSTEKLKLVGSSCTTIGAKDNDLNASMTSTQQAKRVPPPIPLKKQAFIKSTPSTVPDKRILDEELRRASSASDTTTKAPAKTPLQQGLVKKLPSSFFMGRLKNKTKSETQLTKLTCPSSPAFVSYAEKWFIIEPEDYTRVGLPVGNWIGPRDMSFLKTKEIKRQETIFELISTERDYICDLQLVVNLFLAPVRNKNLLNIKEIQGLFSNLEQLLPINQELLQSLERRRLEGRCLVFRIADVFLQLYCMNYPDALNLLTKLCQTRSGFMKWLTQTQKAPSCQGLGLASFLLKPIQRLCKYPLLLKEILKCTPEFHSDETDLAKALTMLNAVVQQVNEGGKFREEQTKLLELHAKLIWNERTIGGLPRNPQRRVVSITMVRKANKQQRWLILLSDAVLLCKPELVGSKLVVRHVWLPPTVITVHDKQGIQVKDGPVLVFDTCQARDAWFEVWKRQEKKMQLEVEEEWSSEMESDSSKNEVVGANHDERAPTVSNSMACINATDVELIMEYMEYQEQENTSK